MFLWLHKKKSCSIWEFPNLEIKSASKLYQRQSVLTISFNRSTSFLFSFLWNIKIVHFFSPKPGLNDGRKACTVALLWSDFGGIKRKNASDGFVYKPTKYLMALRKSSYPECSLRCNARGNCQAFIEATAESAYANNKVLQQLFCTRKERKEIHNNTKEKI